MTIEETMDFYDTYTRKYTHLNINRMKDFMEKLGNPQKDLKFIHVAGTNGKGSCCAMTASILRKAGYKTGLFTSPHIESFNERIQVNGELIPDEALAEITETVKNVNDTLPEERQINWFEFVTAVGLVWFKSCGCDIVVFEVGMGGEFDGTNVIDVPECAVIMNIGLDHTEQLGDTLEKIASAKAGIIKEGGDVVVYRGTPGVEKVFRDTCRQKNAHLHKANFDSIVPISESIKGQYFSVGKYENLYLPLAGEHQQRNTAVVLKVISVLKKKGWKISEKNIRDGIASVQWPVRFEVLSQNPTFIVDGGHNPQCLEAVKEGLLKLVAPDIKIVFLTGILKDKDTKTMSEILSTVGKDYVIVTPPSYRAMQAEELAELFRGEGCNAECCDTIEDGINRAIEKATESGIVCCVGSMYLAGDVRKYFGSLKK